MIKDAKRRKWFMRFKQNQMVGTGKLGAETMANHQERSWTKALAEHYARRSIQGRDAIAASQEYFRRLRMRGTECRLTADDKKAIA